MRQRLYLRRAIGVIIGLALAFALVDAGWHLAGRWFPPTLYDDFGVIDEAPIVVRMPLAGRSIIAIAWFLAGMIGAFAALRVAQWRLAGWITVMPIAIVNLWTCWFVVGSLWFIVASVVAPLLGCFLAERHFHRARPGDPLIN